MSCNYAEGLTPYKNKGKVGMIEIFDAPNDLNEKISLLADWIKNSKYTVFHTGAGISTSAGIPDFRGPNGVWTLEKQGKKPEINLDFNDAMPTLTHMAIKTLVKKGYVKYVVSQNIDGLHLKSGLLREHMSEVHGNMFTMKCNKCNRSFTSQTAVKTVGQQNLNISCLGKTKKGSLCRGILHDTILDWEHRLPYNELQMAELHSNNADLCICLGTSLQIQPINLVPFKAKKNKGKVVICNLQKTMCGVYNATDLVMPPVPIGEKPRWVILISTWYHFYRDRKADLVIHTYVDDMMKSLMGILGVEIENYDEKLDPTKMTNPTDWTIYEIDLLNMQDIKKDETKSKKRKLQDQIL